jgi:hypothetical protein
LYFYYRNGWQCQFIEEDPKTALPKTVTFSDPDKIRELARRGEALGILENKQALEHAIEKSEMGCT